MMFRLFLLALISTLFSFVSALPVVAPLPRDVWVPKITCPDASTTWTVGGTYTVSWDTSSQPKEVTNPQGRVYLRINGATQSSALAQGFPLAAGQVDVTIPEDTDPADDWIIVLFGDSGDWSPPFTITSSESS